MMFAESEACHNLNVTRSLSQSDILFVSNRQLRHHSALSAFDVIKNRGTRRFAAGLKIPPWDKLIGVFEPAVSSFFAEGKSLSCSYQRLEGAQYVPPEDLYFVANVSRPAVFVAPHLLITEPRWVIGLPLLRNYITLLICGKLKSSSSCS